jgi:hypothetical protein
MIDEETGSWWQQISGECILGPLRGKRLQRIASDEVTLAVWRREHPESTIVRFDPRYRHRYAAPDWEKEVSRVGLAGTWDSRSPLPPRELVVGLEVNGKAVAYPLEVVRQHSPIPHLAGGSPVLIVMGADGRSIRSFSRRLDSQVLEFYRKVGANEIALIDTLTGSTWDFRGCAVDGAMRGKCLDRIQNITEYWFDWLRYHPSTGVYRAGR